MQITKLDSPNHETSFSTARWVVRNFHWIVTAALILGMIPAFRLAGLPFDFNWPRLLSVYWVSLFFRSTLVAVILCIAGFPKRTLLPFWNRYWADKGRLVLGLLFAGFMLWSFGWSTGTMLVVDCLALLEFFERSGSRRNLMQMASHVVAPAAYFFIGLLLVFSYNNVIASVEPVDTYTPTYDRMDSILLGGYTIRVIAHAVMERVPVSVYSLLEMIYFGMFGVLGATLMMTAIAYGRKRAMAVVGSLMMAYYIALLVFFLWPSANPYMLCVDHYSKFPEFADLYDIQRATMQKPEMLLMHSSKPVIDTDYFIAFPCMHIALPLIALWYLRQWKRIALLMVGYNVVLFGAILLLEQHFFVDMIGGVLIAALCIAMVREPRQNGKISETSALKDEVEQPELTHV